MTVSELRVSRSAPRQVRRGSRRRLAQALATFRLWRRRAKERGEIGRLNERMLADIGLTRADAVYLANKPFWKE